MSKRVRGPDRSHRRPGARPASERAAAARRRPSSVSTSQLEAAEVVAEDVIEERPAAAAHELEPVTRTVHPRHRMKAGSILAERAASEYVYVAQDLRRIAVVAGLLFGVLFGLWLLLVMLKVIALPFY